MDATVGAPDFRLIIQPPVGAAELSVIVAVEVWSPPIDVGLKTMLAIESPVTVRVALKLVATSLA